MKDTNNNKITMKEQIEQEIKNIKEELNGCIKGMMAEHFLLTQLEAGEFFLKNIAGNEEKIKRWVQGEPVNIIK